MPATLREEPFAGRQAARTSREGKRYRRGSKRQQKGPIRHRTGLKKLRHSHDSNSSVPSAKIVPFPRKNNRDPNCSDRDFNFYARKEQTAIRQRRKRDDAVGGGRGIIGPNPGSVRGEDRTMRSGRAGREGTGGEETIGKDRLLYSPVSRSDRHTARPESRTRAWHAKSPPRAAVP